MGKNLIFVSIFTVGKKWCCTFIQLIKGNSIQLFEFIALLLSLIKLFEIFYLNSFHLTFYKIEFIQFKETEFY